MYITTVILTIFDIVATISGYNLGVVQEGNPIMAKLFNLSPVLTGIFVFILVTALIYLMWKYKNKFKWIRYAITGILGIKVIVVFIHGVWIYNYIRYIL